MKTLIILAAGLFVAGCGGSSDDETVGKEIADDYNKAMDKAREVEDKILEHTEDIDEAVEKAMDEVEDAVEEAEEATEDHLD
ncbi:MAG: hypothetical protein ACE5OQ_08505 [Woeseia sp.]